MVECGRVGNIWMVDLCITHVWVTAQYHGDIEWVTCFWNVFMTSLPYGRAVHFVWKIDYVYD
jgi:hypothetical protein